MRNQPATESADETGRKDLDAQVLDQNDDSDWTGLARDAYTSSEDFYNSSLHGNWRARTQSHRFVWVNTWAATRRIQRRLSCRS